MITMPHHVSLIINSFSLLEYKRYLDIFVRLFLLSSCQRSKVHTSCLRQHL